jgi:hypothetical protein
MPGKCEQLAKLCEAASATSPDQRDQLMNHAKAIQLWCADNTRKSREELKKLTPKDYGYRRVVARLGDAQATIKALGTGDSRGVMRPIHREWRAEALNKLNIQ